VAGGELAGTVAAVGEGVQGWREGDRVMALGPGYAELAAVNAAVAAPVPPELGWEEAGALPVGLYTMHDAIVTNGGLVPGKSVMVNAATAGIGAIGIRIAAQLGASVVIATSRSQAKLAVLAEFLRDLPCPLVTVDLTNEDAVEVTRAHTGGKGVDIIADNVGAGALATNVAAAAILGRIAQIGRLGGRTDELDLDELARKRVSLIGVTFRTRTREEVRAVAAAARRDLDGQLAAVAPRVDRVFSLAEAIAAQDALASDTQVGKIVLIP
jgi:NADPH2:quinone reductase